MLYLKNGVHSGQLAVHGDAEHLRHQVCAQQVGDGLVDVEVAGAHPDFGQKPVILCIRRKEDGVPGSRGLVELVRRRENTCSDLPARPQPQERLATGTFQKDPGLFNGGPRS